VILENSGNHGHRNWILDCEGLVKEPAGAGKKG
jgi:hypothetical protein